MFGQWLYGRTALTLWAPRQEGESDTASESSVELPEHTPLDRPVYVFHTTVKKYPSVSIAFKVWMVSAWLFSLMVLISIVAQLGHLMRRLDGLREVSGFCPRGYV